MSRVQVDFEFYHPTTHDMIINFFKDLLSTNRWEKTDENNNYSFIFFDTNTDANIINEFIYSEVKYFAQNGKIKKVSFIGSEHNSGIKLFDYCIEFPIDFIS